MSTSAAVSETGSPRKSRPTLPEASRVPFWTVTSASGVGLATIAADGSVLDTWFPQPELGVDGPTGTVRLSVGEMPDELAGLTRPDEDPDLQMVAVRRTIPSPAGNKTEASYTYLPLEL